MEDVRNSASKALEVLEDEGMQSNGHKTIWLITIFLTALQTADRSGEFSSRAFALWARSYCALEKIVLTPEIVNNYAAGKFFKKYVQQDDAVIDAAGSYGNRALYKAKEITNAK